MSRKIVHAGGDDDVLPYTNTTGVAIVAGQLLKLLHTMAVALVDIPIAGIGSVAVGGVCSGVPKVSAAVFVQGEKLLYDLSALAFDDSAATPAAGDVMGAAIAWLPGANLETTCTIKLTPGNTTLTP